MLEYRRTISAIRRGRMMFGYWWNVLGMITLSLLTTRNSRVGYVLWNGWVLCARVLNLSTGDRPHSRALIVVELKWNYCFVRVIIAPEVWGTFVISFREREFSSFLSNSLSLVTSRMFSFIYLFCRTIKVYLLILIAREIANKREQLNNKNYDIDRPKVM